VEVQKKKGRPRLPSDENQNVLEYFEHDFVDPVPVDRAIGEHANRLCRQYEAEGLSPCDAIHLACALKAGCDVLLSWDAVLNKINHPDIRTEEPKIQELPERKIDPVSQESGQAKLWGEENETAGTTETTPAISVSADIRRSGVGNPEDPADAEAAEGKAQDGPRDSPEEIEKLDLSRELESETPASEKPAGDQPMDGEPAADPTIPVPTAQNVSAKEPTNTKE